MYRKRDREQQYLEDFRLPFGGKLHADNQWVKLAAMMPWDYIEEVYARSMDEVRGVKAIAAQIAFGALFIKEHENLTGRKTVGYIAENPHMQYFLGLLEFREEDQFDASMMVHFRKRVPSGGDRGDQPADVRAGEAQVSQPFWMRFSHTTILQLVHDFGLLSSGELQPRHFPFGRM